jgi:hypothetical protein
VLAAWDLATVLERSQITPAAFVIYDGEEPVDSAGQGKRILEDQRFLVVLAVRNAQDVLSGTGAREDALVLRGSLLAALSGWQPTPQHRPLQRAKGAPRPYYTTGYAYLPTAFETRSSNP